MTAVQTIVPEGIIRYYDFVKHLMKEFDITQDAIQSITSGNKNIALTDIANYAGQQVTVTYSDTTVARINPSPSYSFTQPRRRRRRNTLIEAGDLNPALVERVVNQYGVHKGTILLTQLLAVPDRTRQPSARALDIMAGRVVDIAPNVRSNPNFSYAKKYVLGQHHIGLSQAIRDAVESGFKELTDSVDGRPIPSHYDTSESELDRFTRDVIVPYSVSVAANRAFVARMSNDIIPQLYYLLEQSEASERTVQKARARIDKQYEELLRNVALKPEDYYLGKDFAILVSPLFMYPDLARYLLPVPHEMHILPTDDYSIAEAFLHQASESSYGANYELRDAKALKKGKMVAVTSTPKPRGEGRRPLKMFGEDSVWEEINSSGLRDGVNNLIQTITSVDDTVPGGYKQSQLRKFNKHMKTLWDGSLNALEGKDVDRENAMFIVDLQGMRPKPLYWPEPLVYGLMHTMGILYENPSLYFDASDEDRARGGFLQRGTPVNLSSFSTDYTPDREKPTLAVIRMVYGRDFNLEEVIVRSAQYAESRGYTPTKGDITFIFHLALYVLENASDMNTEIGQGRGGLFDAIQDLLNQEVEEFEFEIVINEEADEEADEVLTNPTAVAKKGDSGWEVKVGDQSLNDFIQKELDAFKQKVLATHIEKPDEATPKFGRMMEAAKKGVTAAGTGVIDVGTGISAGVGSVAGGAVTGFSRGKEAAGSMFDSAQQTRGTVSRTIGDQLSMVKGVQQSYSLGSGKAIGKIKVRELKLSNRIIRKFPDSFRIGPSFFRNTKNMERDIKEFIEEVENYEKVIEELDFDGGDESIFDRTKANWNQVLDAIDGAESKNNVSHWYALTLIFNILNEEYEVCLAAESDPDTPCFNSHKAYINTLEGLQNKFASAGQDLGLSGNTVQEQSQYALSLVQTLNNKGVSKFDVNDPEVKKSIEYRKTSRPPMRSTRKLALGSIPSGKAPSPAARIVRDVRNRTGVN